MKVFSDSNQLWDALVEITSKGHLPLADGTESVYAEDEDPFANYEEGLADTLEVFFKCDEEQGTWNVGRTGCWPDCFQIGIAQDFFSQELVTLMRDFLRRSIPDASVYFFLESPDCNEGEIVGNLAVFHDRIWATQNISDFLSLHLANECGKPGE